MPEKRLEKSREPNAVFLSSPCKEMVQLMDEELGIEGGAKLSCLGIEGES